jgi:hypothetical protein
MRSTHDRNDKALSCLSGRSLLEHDLFLVPTAKAVGVKTGSWGTPLLFNSPIRIFYLSQASRLTMSFTIP